MILCAAPDFSCETGLSKTPNYRVNYRAEIAGIYQKKVIRSCWKPILEYDEIPDPVLQPPIKNVRDQFMNLVLDRYADNPIIDELVSWPPNPQKVKSLRGCFPMIRKPFIEIEYVGGESIHRHFAKSSFVEFWSEAIVIVGAITDIDLISEFKFPPVQNRENFKNEILESRQECIEESKQIFAAGMFQLFLDQYGANYSGLPADVIRKIAEAKDRISAEKVAKSK
jgi:hypothetical protein